MKFKWFTTILVMAKTAVYSIYYCGLSVIKSWMGTLTREWTNGAARRWAKKIIRAVKINMEVHNPHNTQAVKGERTILMINHTSHYDIPITLLAFPGSIRMLAKKELAKIPIFGGSLKVTEHVLIDRKNREQAIKDLATAEKRLDSGIILWVAPEGTRSPTGHLGRFKKGGFITAINTKAKIIPIGIRGAFDVLPPKTWNFALHKKVDVHIGKPIDASKYTLAEKEALMTEVEDALRLLINEPKPRSPSHDAGDQTQS